MWYFCWCQQFFIDFRKNLSCGNHPHSTPFGVFGVLIGHQCVISIWISQKAKKWGFNHVQGISQWCNLTFAQQLWATKVCLWASKISKICLIGCLTGRATSWKANFENYSRSFPETLKYWVGVQWDQSYLMGRRYLFSLGWQPF